MRLLIISLIVIALIILVIAIVRNAIVKFFQKIVQRNPNNIDRDKNEILYKKDDVIVLKGEAKNRENDDN